jgi:hypothetical protein
MKSLEEKAAEVTKRWAEVHNVPMGADPIAAKGHQGFWDWEEKQ